MLFGFLFLSPQDLQDFKTLSKEVPFSFNNKQQTTTTLKSKVISETHPVFNVHERSPKYVRESYLQELSALGIAPHMWM